MSNKYKYNRNKNGNSNNSSFTNYYFANDIKKYSNSSSKSQRTTDNSEILSNNARPVIKATAVEVEMSKYSNSNTNIIPYNINKSQRTSKENFDGERDNHKGIDVDVVVGAMTVRKLESLQAFNTVLNQTSDHSSGRHSSGKQSNNFNYAGGSGNTNCSSSSSLIFEHQPLQPKQLKLMLHSGRKKASPKSKIDDTSLYTTNDRPKLPNIVDPLRNNVNLPDIEVDSELMYVVEADTDNKDVGKISLVRGAATRPHINAADKNQLNAYFGHTKDNNINETYTKPKAAKDAKSNVLSGTKHRRI